MLFCIHFTTNEKVYVENVLDEEEAIEIAKSTSNPFSESYLADIMCDEYPKINGYEVTLSYDTEYLEHAEDEDDAVSIALEEAGPEFFYDDVYVDVEEWD